MFAELPPPLQDILLVLAIGTLAAVIVISAAQDLKGRATTSANLEWAFGGVVLSVFLYGSLDRPLRFVATLVVAALYGYAIRVTYMKYRSQDREKH